MATYYAIRKTVNDGVPQPATNKYGTMRAMQRQYHLFCANALDGDDFPNDIDSIEWGTLELGVQERVCFVKEIPEPEEEIINELDEGLE